MAQLRHRFGTERPNIATRRASQLVINAIAEALPNFLGGSADLTHSNLTQAKTQRPVRQDSFEGSYIHYGVREHAMAAAMNGIALHGGFIPYGGTFLSFADYSRPAIRLAALMGIRVIHVMTHDSIGLGEDGPTHQPVEHLAALRATPSRPQRPGIAHCAPKQPLRCCACHGRRFPRSVKLPATQIGSRAAPMWLSNRRMAAASP
jgi:transketolase